MTNMEDIRKKSDRELTDLVKQTREMAREERFKDKWSRKAHLSRGARKTTARVLTELSKRRNEIK